MQPVFLVTSNKYKIQSANLICQPFGIVFKQLSLNIPEIQSLEGTAIAKDKTAKAYKLLGKPLIVEDGTWTIPALNGFPGPYMAQMNQWFTLEDFARLFKPLKDRRIILTQCAVYQDKRGQKIFTSHTEGILLEKPRGKSRYPHSAFTSFDGGKRSSAEYGEAGQSSLTQHRTAWHDFAEWYTTHHAEA